MKLKMDVTDVVSQIRSGDKTGVLMFLSHGGDPNSRNQLGWTLLHLACLEGKENIAEVLLEAGASVNSCTTDMCTPLHRACGQGNVGTVEVLLKKDAYINAQDKNGNTPLHIAAKALHTSVAKVLVNKKADKTRLNKKNQLFTNMIGQQMMPTIESGDIDVLVQWLDWGLSPNTVGNLNWSILHHASARGQINIASLLLERGANVNARDSNKGTALHAASQYGFKRIVDLLIAKGANVNLQDQLGNTPLHTAIAGAHPDIINSLLENDCDTTIPNAEGQIFTHLVNEFLVEAVENKRVAHVCSLLKGRADPNANDSRGYPVLCCAAFQEDLLTLDSLLEAGGNPNVCSENNLKTPLHYAASWGNLFILKSLLDKGASASARDRGLRTPLHEAAREGADDVVTVLIGRSSPLDAQDSEGNTPLHIAARWGQSDIVELLIEKGARDDIKNKDNHSYMDLALMRAVRTEDAAQLLSCLAWGGDPNVRDSKGWSLLHHAVYKTATEVVRLLIESESEVNVSDKEGRTPLLLAAYRGHVEITKILLAAGADTDAQDRQERTPLHWAAAEGSADTVELLLLEGAKRNIKNKEGQLYTDLLVKHLYLAVRHNDSAKVERLLKAGANQTAQVRGTGITSRDEAKRRKHYPLLREMIAAAPKVIKASLKEETTGIEDICRLFEDCNSYSQLEGSDGEASNTDSSAEEEYDPDEDAYWRMHNASMVLSAKEMFEEETKDFWENWEDRPKPIPVRELFKAEEEAFWKYWKDNSTTDSEEESDDNSGSIGSKEGDPYSSTRMENIKRSWGTVVPAKEFFREDECWWRDAVEDLDKPRTITAKEFFKDDIPWWQKDSEDSNGNADDDNKIDVSTFGQNSSFSLYDDLENESDTSAMFSASDNCKLKNVSTNPNDEANDYIDSESDDADDNDDDDDDDDDDEGDDEDDDEITTTGSESVGAEDSNASSEIFIGNLQEVPKSLPYVSLKLPDIEVPGDEKQEDMIEYEISEKESLKMQAPVIMNDLKGVHEPNNEIRIEFTGEETATSYAAAKDERQNMGEKKTDDKHFPRICTEEINCKNRYKRSSAIDTRNVEVHPRTLKTNLLSQVSSFKNNLFSDDKKEHIEAINAEYDKESLGQGGILDCENFVPLAKSSPTLEAKYSIDDIPRKLQENYPRTKLKKELTWVSNPIFSEKVGKLHGTNIGQNLQNISERALEIQNACNKTVAKLSIDESKKTEQNLRKAKNYVNDMDECLARIAASLSCVNSRMEMDKKYSPSSPDSNEREESPKERLPPGDSTQSSDHSSTDEKTNIPKLNIFKINVRVPEELVSTSISTKKSLRKRLKARFCDIESPKIKFSRRISLKDLHRSHENLTDSESTNNSSSLESLILSADLTPSSSESFLESISDGEMEKENQTIKAEQRDIYDHEETASFEKTNQTSKHTIQDCKTSEITSNLMYSDSVTNNIETQTVESFFMTEPTRSASSCHSLGNNTVSNEKPVIPDECYGIWNTYSTKTIQEYDCLASVNKLHSNHSLYALDSSVESQDYPPPISTASSPTTNFSENSCVAESTDIHVESQIETETRFTNKEKSVDSNPLNSSKPLRHLRRGNVHNVTFAPLYYAEMSNCSDRSFSCNSGLPTERLVTIEAAQKEPQQDKSTITDNTDITVSLGIFQTIAFIIIVILPVIQ